MAAQRMRRSGGFTYLSLIIVVAIIGLVAASALKLGSVLQRSRAEQQLLEIGAAFSDALQSYAEATPAGMPPQPPSLNDLLKDPRFQTTRRHLRKLFVDPMTGKAEWGVVYLGDKVGVLAVYSLSKDKPVKIGHFPERYSGFEGKNSISDWKFTGSPKTAGVAAVVSPPLAAPLLAPAPQQTAPAPTGTPAPLMLPPVTPGENPAPPSEEPPVAPAPPAVEPPPDDAAKGDPL